MSILSRRHLLSGLGAASAPLFVPRRVLGMQGQRGANDTIRVGFIGAGNRANLLMDQLPKEGAEIVAVADCFLPRAYEAAGKRRKNWRVYGDYRKLLEQKDVDAIVEGTTDHGRVLVNIRACEAGKDVYSEKPLTLYIAEGRALVRAARRYDRIVQTGTQQRSMAMNQIASRFVGEGGLGKVHLVLGTNYPGPNMGPKDPSEPAPPGLDWDMWLGQTPQQPYARNVYYGWGFPEFSGGEMTNWGAHGIDQIQAALGTSNTGPVEFFPISDGPPGAVGFRYANGTTVRLELPMGEFVGGAVFLGEKGRVEIVRNNFRTDPPRLIKDIPPPDEVQKWRDDVALWQAKYHMGNWLDCIRSRQTPIADVEIGHRSVTIAHICNITRKLGRRLRWNPETEQFTDDPEANALTMRPRRKGYELPAV